MTFVPGTPPTVTEAPCKFVPVIVTAVPPTVVPNVGVMSVNVGGPIKVNVPGRYRAAAVRQVGRCCARCMRRRTRSDRGFVELMGVARRCRAAKVTPVTDVKPLPPMFTVVNPVVGPCVGVRLVGTGVV